MSCETCEYVGETLDVAVVKTAMSALYQKN